MKRMTTTLIKAALQSQGLKTGWWMLVLIMGNLAVLPAKGQGDLTLTTTIHHGLTGDPVPIGHEFNLFGFSAAAVGSDRFAVGIPYQERIILVDPLLFKYDIFPGVGAVQLYGNFGTQVISYLVHPNFNPNDSFGYAMASVGSDRFLVGAPNAHHPTETSSGAAYLYDYNGILLQTLYAPDPTRFDFFSAALSAVGNTHLLIGEPFDDFKTQTYTNANAGVVHVYDANGNYLFLRPNPAPDKDDSFGWAVAGVGTDRFVVGAPFEDTSGPDAGRVYLFDTSNTLIKEIYLRNDTSSDKFNQTEDDGFGYTLAGIGQGRFLVGAPGVTLDSVNLTNGLPEFHPSAGMVSTLR